MKSIELPEPHTKLYSIEVVGDGLERAVARVEHTVEPFFTTKETALLMVRYAKVQATLIHAALRAEEADEESRKAWLYSKLMLKASRVMREFESKMDSWV